MENVLSRSQVFLLGRKAVIKYLILSILAAYLTVLPFTIIIDGIEGLWFFSGYSIPVLLDIVLAISTLCFLGYLFSGYIAINIILKDKKWSTQGIILSLVLLFIVSIVSPLPTYVFSEIGFEMVHRFRLRDVWLTALWINIFGFIPAMVVGVLFTRQLYKTKLTYELQFKGKQENIDLEEN